tara:strand:- start:257 stop:508 length:252 start_codon:yes stop_codon:yes gene_type:complete
MKLISNIQLNYYFGFLKMSINVNTNPIVIIMAAIVKTWSFIYFLNLLIIICIATITKQTIEIVDAIIITAAIVVPILYNISIY